MVTITEEEYNKLRNYEDNENLLCTIKRINDMIKDENAIETINQLGKVSEEQIV